MEINAEKTKVMTDNAKDIRETLGSMIRDIRGDIGISDKRLETVNQSKYISVTVRDEGSKPEIMSRIAQAIHAMSQLKIIWNDKKHISPDKNKADVHTCCHHFFLCL